MKEHIERRKEARFLRRNIKLMLDALLICKAEQHFKLNKLNIELVRQRRNVRIVLILIVTHTTKHMRTTPGRAALKTM